MSALSQAYREYLDRMVLKSDDLVDVIEETIPEDGVNIPVMLEWCDIV